MADMMADPQMDSPKAEGEVQTDRDIVLDDTEDPLNWSPKKKWPLSIIVIMMSGTMGYYSGVHAASIPAVADYYHASQLASTSAVSFFLLGFATGPLLFAPLSEMFGRLPIIWVTLFLFVLSNIGCALAPNIQTLLAFRFIGGLLGAPTGSRRLFKPLTL